MNEIQCKSQVNEIISLDKNDEIQQNGVLSQKINSRHAKRFKLAFLLPKTQGNPTIYRIFTPASYGVVDIAK